MQKKIVSLRPKIFRFFRIEKLQEWDPKTKGEDLSVMPLKLARVHKKLENLSITRNWSLSNQKLDEILKFHYFGQKNRRFSDMKMFFVKFCERDPISTISVYQFFFHFQNLNKIIFFKDNTMSQVFQHHFQLFMKSMNSLQLPKVFLFQLKFFTILFLIFILKKIFFSQATLLLPEKKLARNMIIAEKINYSDYTMKA